MLNVWWVQYDSLRRRLVLAEDIQEAAVLMGVSRTQVETHGGISSSEAEAEALAAEPPGAVFERGEDGQCALVEKAPRRRQRVPME